MKGYKNFDKGLLCRGFQFEVGKTYKHKGSVMLCNAGFHFHSNKDDLFKFYEFDFDKTVTCEIEASGEILHEDCKSVCSKIKIIKILTTDELKSLGNITELNKNLGWANLGRSNTGDSNTGHRNTGHSNTGHSNTGRSNTGHRNTGHSNTGDWNTGDWNTGRSNTGHRNTGHSNTGHSNTGRSNTGHSNTGRSNTGHRNTGHRNTGHSNTGDWNTGDWNIGDRNTGFFNTIEPKTILIFNKDCYIDEWEKCNKPNFIYNIILTEWVHESNMTDTEKKKQPLFYVQRGYLKEIEYKTAWKIAFESRKDDDIAKLKALPNFDSVIFEEITGIKIK